MTVLDEVTLKKIASETGGVYVRSDPDEFGLLEVYENLSSRVNKNTQTEDITKTYKERFQFFLTAAFLLLITEILMGRKNKKRQKG